MNRMWFLAVLAAFAAVAHGFETGAKDISCDDMRPQHGPEAVEQVVAFPYNVKFSANKIPSGGKMTVTLSGKNSFRGFFVQGRVGNKAIGHFDVVPRSKLVNCHGSAGSAITHSDRDYKKSITLIWNAPKGLSENVVFWVTVVKEGKEFWVGHKTPAVTVGKN